MLFRKTRTSRIRRIAAGVAIVCASGTASGETVPVDMAIAPAATFNTMNMTLSATFLGSTKSDSDTSTVTGNVLGNLGIAFDESGQHITSIDTLELTGGHFAVSDVSFTLNYGFVIGKVDVTSKGLGGTFDTPNPPGLVTKAVTGYEFSAADHQTILNQGTFKAQGTMLVGAALPQNPMTVDLSQEPTVASGSGSGQIALGQPSYANGVGTFSVELMMPGNIDQIVYHDPATATVRVKGTGNFKAVGSFQRAIQPYKSSWNINGGGNWREAGNWAGSAPASALDQAYFLGALTTYPIAMINLDPVVPTTVSGIVFDNPIGYYLLGGELRLEPFSTSLPPAIEVVHGTHYIASGIRAKGELRLSVNDGKLVLGTLSLEKSDAGTPPSLTVTGGGVVNLSPLSVSSDTPGWALRVNGARLETGQLMNQPQLTIDGGGEVQLQRHTRSFILSAIDIPQAGEMGRLDINDIPITVDGGSGTGQQTLDTLTALVKRGRNGREGLWKGMGLTSSMARDNANTGVGVIANWYYPPGSTTPVAIHENWWPGPVSADSVLIKYTWNGDANLDGIVNADDYGLIDRGFISQKGGWYNGDFNYDDIVNADDYGLIDRAFIAQNAPLSSDLSLILHRSSFSSVPEPTVISVNIILYLLTFARHRCVRCRHDSRVNPRKCGFFVRRGSKYGVQWSHDGARDESSEFPVGRARLPFHKRHPSDLLLRGAGPVCRTFFAGLWRRSQLDQS